MADLSRTPQFVPKRLLIDCQIFRRIIYEIECSLSDIVCAGADGAGIFQGLSQNET